MSCTVLLQTGFLVFLKILCTTTLYYVSRLFFFPGTVPEKRGSENSIVYIRISREKFRPGPGIRNFDLPISSLARYQLSYPNSIEGTDLNLGKEIQDSSNGRALGLEVRGLNPSSGSYFFPEISNFSFTRRKLNVCFYL